ncbi:MULTISPECIES: ComEC/Rec2 family competence protein [unclassified Coleofasciculus]|uniref:ComEC/Rec2 family competence protein n=1 Tax=unclassified Coleofasciculus TaxID=2692782 RepID=UPI001880C212|nr:MULTISPECIES: ComEC/Rec2 family competence protein [unclassified Coleofasciculus]MBE9129759.1 ComEC/Rec2 family competence protein [Coleofasciculus sp. LEGE 07081]MBE9152239.1 ComEC/Rec2 family competence protein [Coleofasciculus sp. LEGE 07092]
MNPASGAILSLAYILALLSTAMVGLPTRDISWQEYGLLMGGIGGLGILAAIAIPQVWRTGPKARLWLAAGVVGILAIAYFQVRIPQPASNDISKFVASDQGTVQGQVVMVQGKVETVPRLTRSSKGQFWLEVTQLNEVQSSNSTGAISQGVTGKLYVTVPLLQATGLFPDEMVAVTGVLYKPKPAANPGAFDFEAYLAKEGVFAGLSGRQVTLLDEGQQASWQWWRLRQRIVRAQVSQLGSPAGQLVSSMVLGNQAVDIPYNVRDQFVGAGLAHALAASGTQTALILGLVLMLTKRLSAKAQLIFGTIALIVFVGLTGLQPSVMRAAVMGFGALVALVTQRKVKPLGSLLLAATILLVFNPLWIWDLGFQLSFLATLGLLVTVPPLMKQLDWLPSAIGSAIAIPLAASLWTLPLQLYVFSILAPYSIAANILSAPLIALISIGSFISAFAALISPAVGSALAWLLYYPVQLLIGLVQFFNGLPGNSVAVGTISLVQLLLLYGLISLSCISWKVRQKWWLAGIVALMIVVIPTWQTRIEQFQVTILGADREQVLVVQDRGRVTLVNSGEADTASFTVLPFLHKQGVNQIDSAIALDSEPRLRSGWVPILESLLIRRFYDCAPRPIGEVATTQQQSLADTGAIAAAVQSQQGTYEVVSSGQRLAVGATAIKLINAEPPIVQLQVQDRRWLLVEEIKPEIQQKLAATGNLPQTQVLWWAGQPLTPEFLEFLKPEVAIASSDTVDLQAAKLLEKAKIPLYWTGRDGAIQWTPDGGFETTLQANRNDAPLL